MALAGWLLTLGLLGIALVLLVREIAINLIAWWVFGSLEGHGWAQWGALRPWALLLAMAVVLTIVAFLVYDLGALH